MAIISAIEDRSREVRRAAERSTDFRQLRHQTKNTLQRIICRILEEPALSQSPAGRRAAEELVHRIEISAAISDALFGLRHPPFPLPDRIGSLVDSLIALHADTTQAIALDLQIAVGIAPSLEREGLILRIVHEIVLNALKHGMDGRPVGKITIRILPTPCGGLTMSICNDGWAMDSHVARNEGLALVWELADQEGGQVGVTTQPTTGFQVDLPPENRSYPVRMMR